MDYSYLNLVLAVAAFVGLHMAFPRSKFRARMIERSGENAYLGLYSLVAAATLVWAVWAFIEAPAVKLWTSGPALRHVLELVVLVAIALQVCALTIRNPTAVGAGGLPQKRGEIPGIIRITRHPLMWGIALWALAHIAATGRLDTLIFFGAFAFLALVGPARIDARKASQGVEGWEVFSAQTSYLPFAAILSGRTSVTPSEIGMWRLLVAPFLFIVIYAAHGWLFGVPLM